MEAVDPTTTGMEPDSKSLRPQLSDEQWKLISDLLKPPKESPNRAAGPELIRGLALRASCGVLVYRSSDVSGQ